MPPGAYYIIANVERLPGKTAAEKKLGTYCPRQVWAAVRSAFFREGRGGNLLRFWFRQAGCRARRSLRTVAEAVKSVQQNLADYRSALLCQPFLQVRFQQAALFDAAVNILESVVSAPRRRQKPGEWRRNSRHRRVPGGAETIGTGNQVRAQIGGQVSVHLVPMFLDESPGRIASIGIFETDCELNCGVLDYALCLRAEYSRPRSRSAGLSNCTSKRRAVSCRFGIGGGLIDLLQPVEESCVTVLSRGFKGRLRQRRVDGCGIVKELIGNFSRIALEIGVVAMIDEEEK